MHPCNTRNPPNTALNGAQSSIIVLIALATPSHSCKSPNIQTLKHSNTAQPLAPSRASIYIKQAVSEPQASRPSPPHGQQASLDPRHSKLVMSWNQFFGSDTTGYPYVDGNRTRRTPYEDRIYHDLMRAGDPYASRPSNMFARERLERERFGGRRRENPLAPIITITDPVEQRRHSLPDLERAGLFAAFARLSATPPPRQSRNRIDGFERRFGEYEREERSYANERLATEPFGPPDAYSGRRSRIEQQGRRFLPYGGFGAPRNPFAPGGSSYDRQFSDRPRSASHAGSRFNDEERRRRDFYRSHVAEPWGVAEYDAYEYRRRAGYRY